MICRKLYPAFKLKNAVGYVNEVNQLICKTQPKNGYSQLRLQPPVAKFCTQELPKNSDVFGDISGRKFEHVEMSELEQEEENFRDSEGCIPRRLKPSIGRYGQMIKSHLSKKDIDSALKVLDMVKENRDKPTMYMYNLLIRALSIQGNIKKCFSLYNKAKKRSLQPNAATYTALFNACAMSDNKKLALEHLNNLRQSLYEQQFPLNQTHYNVMVKGYGWHNQVGEAFQLVDEMMDNRIPIGESTFNSLFHAAIADKENGLRHALTTWHVMCHWKVKRSLCTYNLLLRTIRDSKLGDVKINDVLLPGYESTRILLKEGEMPDLLASPPFISTLLPLIQTKQSNVTQHSLIKTNEQNLPEEAPINLNNVLTSNRLLLFGGIDGLLSRMAADNVKPDAKTITMLLDLIPNTVSAENLLLKTVDKNNIQLDIDFYNMLIKRRSMRREYRAAKEVIQITEKKSLAPNVMTFGVLALGCQEYNDAREFLAGIEAFGYKPNVVIMGTLIRTACFNKNLGYVLFMMEYMKENRIKPNTKIIQMLVEFSNNMQKLRKPKGKGKMRRLRNFEKNIYKFEETLSKWQEKNENNL
ncbi:pentatricopeptide repeat-containing protein 1, mitochondrial isoform X2 [Odontomachus brunneus]|uniref:pentatricopeptide repeat-containing protein 1, mitochondrial isoform X2 n=1 Tax=Odontomachus brunneus TaxID=486640 RepID=UPI0013F1F76C|nr:pentatricopeptide repeat-containing protein 1, mitochondrial isoform X2 [Odontomachus brunneus]